MKAQPITPAQTKLIHTIKGALKLDDALYRDILHERFRVTSSKELSQIQAASLIDELEIKAKAAGVWESRHRNPGKGAKKGKAAYADLDNRDNMATAAQLRRITRQWAEVSRAEDAESRKKALRAFVLRVAKVSDVRFLNRDGAGAMIRALTAMQERQEKHREAV